MSYFTCRNCGRKLHPLDHREGYCSISCEMGIPVEDEPRDPDEEPVPSATTSEPIPVSDSEDRDE